MKHEIVGYTGKWDQVGSAGAVCVGDDVALCEQCDDREWGAFRRVLKSAGLSLRWLSYDGDTAMDQHEVVMAPNPEAEGLTRRAAWERRWFDRCHADRVATGEAFPDLELLRLLGARSSRIVGSEVAETERGVVFSFWAGSGIHCRRYVAVISPAGCRDTFPGRWDLAVRVAIDFAAGYRPVASRFGVSREQVLDALRLVLRYAEEPGHG